MAQTFLEKIKISDKFYLIPEKRGIKKGYIIFLRILLVSFHRFIADDCLTRASAIAYTNIVSLVPVLTVALAFLTISSGVNEKQDELFDSINTFLQKNEIRVDITPYLETLKDIVSSATQIGAIGFIVLIFSATAILRTFEAAFNQIWRITTPRPFMDKIIFYFFILAIGPLLAAIFTSFAAKFADATRASHLYSITRSSDNYLWMTGENGTIVKIEENGKRLAKLKDFKIDFENMNCINLDKDVEANCDMPQLNKETFVKIRNRKNQLVTASENGIILQSFDLGVTWSITEILNAKIWDFTIADENNMYIVLTNGDIINYHHKNKYDKVFVNYRDSEDKVVATKIRFPDPENGYFLDANGYFWKTVDGGKTFQYSKVTKGTLNLTDLAILDNNNYAVVGERGGIFRSHDAGKTWIDISHKKVSYTKIWYMQDEGHDELIVLNDLGAILYSNDLGNKWQLTYTPTNGKLYAMIPINPKFGFNAMNPEDDTLPTEEELAKQKEQQVVGDILAVGEFGKISIGDVKDGALVWHTIAGGDNVFSVYSFIKTIIPLSAIWIFFMMLYMLIPNIKIPFKAAAIGSAITGVILLAFIWGFGIYLRSFATSTMVVYRALAAVPIFLLVVYCFSIIMLFGAEITATLHYRDRYNSNRNPFDDGEEDIKYTFYNSIKYLVLLYTYQSQNKSFLSANEIKSSLEISTLEFEALTEKLVSDKFIARIEGGQIAPCIMPVDLSLYDLYDKISHESYELPGFADKQGFVIKISEQLKEVNNFSKQTLSKIKFSELLV